MGLKLKRSQRIQASQVSVPIADFIQTVKVSKTQIQGRTSETQVLDFAVKMILGEWDWARPDSEPVLFRSPDGVYFVGDGHHTGMGLAVAYDPDVARVLKDRLEIADHLIHAALPKIITCKIFACDDLESAELAAHRYSRTTANRTHGMQRSPAQRAMAAKEILVDQRLLGDVIAWIQEQQPKKKIDAAAVPSARAIAAYIGDISHPTVQGIWNSLRGAKFPWLDQAILIGLDGDPYELKRSEELPEEVPQVESPKTSPLNPPTVESGDSMALPKLPSQRSDDPPLSREETPPEVPIQRFTGKAMAVRVQEYSSEIATEIAVQISQEMDIVFPRTSLIEHLEEAIKSELLLAIGAESL